MAGHIFIEDAKLIYRPNFSGAKTQFKEEGNRAFNVQLDPKLADQLANDGWNVKLSNPKNEEEEPVPFIEVTVRFNQYPPRIVMIGETSRKRTELNEDTVDVLDTVYFANIDLKIRGREWEPGRVKAYLASGYFTIEEDYLDLKYAREEEMAGSTD